MEMNGPEQQQNGYPDYDQVRADEFRLEGNREDRA
jgi:hypothetical protein